MPTAPSPGNGARVGVAITGIGWKMLWAPAVGESRRGSGRIRAGVQARSVVARRTPVAAPDHRRQQRFEREPHLVGQVARQAFQRERHPGLPVRDVRHDAGKVLSLSAKRRR